MIHTPDCFVVVFEDGAEDEFLLFIETAEESDEPEQPVE